MRTNLVIEMPVTRRLLTTCRDGVYEGASEVGVRTPNESIDFGTEIFMFTHTCFLMTLRGVGANYNLLSETSMTRQIKDSACWVLMLDGSTGRASNRVL